MKPGLLLYLRLLPVLLFLTVNDNKATAQHFYLQKYTANEGLPDSYVLSVLQDSHGFLWIGTVNGLSRWDGSGFFNYGYGEGLPNLSVDLVYEDHLQRLWASTRKGPVGIRGRKCISYPMDDHQSISYVFGIQELKDGALLTLTDKGVYRLDSCQWKKQSFYPGFDNHACRQMIETDSGLFINYGDRLIFRDKSGKYRSASSVSRELDHYHNLAVYKGHLVLSVPEGMLSIRQGGNQSLFKTALHGKHMEGFFYDSRGRCWLSTMEDGLLVSKPGSEQNISDTIPIAYNLTASMCEDREGNIWVACFDGLLKIREVDYTVFDELHYPLLHNTRNLFQAPGQDLIVSSHSGLLSCRDGELKQAQLTPMKQPGKTTDDVVDFWCTDAQNKVFLATRWKKIYLFEKNRLKDLSYLARSKEDWYGGICFDRKNDQLYLSADSLLYGDEEGLHLFKDAENGRPIIQPRALHYFDNGNLFIHTANNEFILADSSRHTRDVSKAMGIPASNAGLFFCDGSCGRFWIGYNGGLIRYRWDGRLTPVQELRITNRDGLPNNAIHALAMDSLQRLWAITSSGLVVVDTESSCSNKPVIHLLSEEMGISYNQWIQAKLLVDANGEIWMSFLNSLYKFDPKRIHFGRKPPSVAIEEVRLNLRPMQWKEQEQAVLPYYSNNLSISFKAPCFNGNSGIEYSYQMGNDSGWSSSGRNSTVTFVKIPPGSYHFKVRARKSDTDWGEAASFSFRIERPWWDRLWFRWLGTVVFITSTFFLFTFRTRQIRRKALIREQLQELELRALRSQMNPHFIYNALNSIQALVVDNRPQEASLYIGKFGRLLRKILDHSDRNIITLREELEALELYVELERLRLNVHLAYCVNIETSISTGDEWLPPLILQPFVENALWHGLSRKAGEKSLDLHISLQDESLVIRIVDNGIGREKAAAFKSALKTMNTSKGIEITTRRIKEYNQGAAPLVISIKDLYSPEFQAAGTEVVVKIRRKRKPAAD